MESISIPSIKQWTVLATSHSPSNLLSLSHTNAHAESKRQRRKLKPVMENEPGTIGLENGAIDVKRLLVEPEDGYFRLQNDFCSMGDEYLQGVEFGDSITNLDYSSGGRLQTLGSDSLTLSSSAGTGSPWKSDLFRVEVPGCQLNVDRSKLGNNSSQHEYDTLANEKHSSCTLKDLGKFHNISSCSFEEILSDENGGSVSTLREKVDKFELTGKDIENSKFHGQNEFATNSAQIDHSDTFPAQKRSRKPTQRYIDESEDPISRFSKKRQGAFSALKNKNVGGKGCKKHRMVSSTVALPVDEISVKAIQVPFATVVQKECPKSESHDLVRQTDDGKLMTRLKESYTSTANHKGRDDGVSVSHLKKRSERLAAASQKRRGDFVISVSPKKRGDFIVEASPKKRDEQVAIVSEKKRDDCYSASRRKKRVDDFFSSECLEEGSGRRKHHILWTIEEVRKLLDGVSQYGVGRWSHIKKLLFSSSAHRTSVDLKDKWRNLLKASGILERGNGQGGKKRNATWRPLPKLILGRVCELAAMHPYPKDRIQISSHNTSHDDDDSPGTSRGVTLNDYRRILGSVN